MDLHLFLRFVHQNVSLVFIIYTVCAITSTKTINNHNFAYLDHVKCLIANLFHMDSNNCIYILIFIPTLQWSFYSLAWPYFCLLRYIHKQLIKALFSIMIQLFKFILHHHVLFSSISISQ